MTVDKRVNHVGVSFKGLIKARYLASKRKSIRSFQLLKMNLLDINYIITILWNNTPLLSQPLLRRVTNQEIWSKVQSRGTEAEWNCDQFPCHSQAVEQCVKLVTEASQKVVVCNSRDGLIRITLKIFNV